MQIEKIEPLIGFGIMPQKKNQIKGRVSKISGMIGILIKAALINVYVLTIDQMCMCSVKGLACKDKSTESWENEKIWGDNSAHLQMVPRGKSI